MSEQIKKNLKNNNRFIHIFKKGDVILLILLIVSIIVSIIFAVSDGSDIVEIYIDGKLAYQLDINVNQDIKLLDGAMTVVVRDKKVYVKESNCPEQLCVHSSPISKEGGMIVCLPNKVVIKVASREVDAIS